MKIRLYILLVMVFATYSLTSQELVDPVNGNDAALQGILPDEAREYILFSNNGFLFGSYMRVGLHQNTSMHLVEGAGLWNVENGYNGMRFMNEANYSEWLLAYESPRDDPDWWGGAYLRMAYDIPDFSGGWLNISQDSYGIILPEAFFRVGFSSGWNIWLGRRYNDKVAINMMDYYVANLDANGVGVEGLNIGSASLDVHWLFSYDPDAYMDTNLFTHPGKQTLAFVFKRVKAGPGDFTFIIAPSYQSGGVADLDVNDDGSLDNTPFTLNNSGGGFATAKYYFNSFFGLDGDIEFFVSSGFGTGANQNADTDIDDYALDDWSVFGGFQGYAIVNETVSWRMTAYYEHRSWETEQNFISLGFRPLFKLTQIFGIQLEYDLEAAITTGKLLNRISLAPTFVPPGGDTTSGLQIMPYISYGYGDFEGGNSIAISDGSRHGVTFGVFGNVGF